MGAGAFLGRFGHGGAFGYQSDSTGLQLLGHRYYDPAVGRFLTPDPIKDGRNWFAYCENNPLSRVDPNGLDWHDAMHVNVDPGFKGKVWVVGEPSRGKGQVVVELKPGQGSPPGMDVDYVIIVHPGGTIERLFLQGLGYLSPGDQYETSTIDDDGRVSGPGLVLPISFVPGWRGRIEAAKRRPAPSAGGWNPVYDPVYYSELPEHWFGGLLPFPSIEEWRGGLKR